MTGQTPPQLDRALTDGQDSSIDLLTRLVACPSVTGEPSTIMDLLVPELADLGFDVDVLPVDLDGLAEHPEYSPPPRVEGEQPPVLHARYSGAGEPAADGQPTPELMLFAHTDTEPVLDGWTADPFVLRADGGRLTGLGVADDKAGVVAILAAVRAVRASGVPMQRLPRVVLGAGKQGGALGTLPGTVASAGVLGSVYCHPAESEQGLAHLKVASRGVAQLEVLVPGLAPEPSEPRTAMSADPRQGRSALLRAARLAATLTAASSDALVVEATALDAGAGPYQVPDQARLVLSCWFVDGRVEDLVGQMQERLAAAAADDWERANPPTVGVVGTRANPASCAGSPFAAWSTDLIQDVTGSPVQDYAWHSASDIRFPMRCLDVPAVGFGGLAGSFYTGDEWVDVASLHRTTAVLARMLTDAGPR